MGAPDHDTGVRSGLRIVSLFTGLGALDLGLANAGHRVMAACESWEPARRVLKHHFPDIPVNEDVRTFKPTVEFDVLSAGFPCTDISHAGARAGINGEASGLVEHVFRIASENGPRWILLENVPNLLSLHSGAGMQHITHRLQSLGYRWAYRTVDTRFTGLPQRRPRVIILASRDDAELESRLLAEDNPAPHSAQPDGTGAAGFYWTEGRTGLGLVSGALPTLKGGSMLGLPCAPAIWLPDRAAGRKFVLPTVEDGEALQGLPRGWSKPSLRDDERDLRWKLVGNAVTVGIGQWVGERLAETDLQNWELAKVDPLKRDKRWPVAGWGDSKGAWQADRTAFPRRMDLAAISDVVEVDDAPHLSHRATAGFLSRLDESGRQVPERFYADLEEHLAATRPALQPKTSWASSDTSKRRMQAQKSKNTKPELAIRRALHGMGLRYRVQYRPDPKMRVRVDLAFIGAKVAVDVRGCFWHSCPKHRTFPKANAERWAAKLAKNVERDAATVSRLTEAGWHVEVVWEHEDPVAAAKRIAGIVRSRTPDPPPSNPLRSQG